MTTWNYRVIRKIMPGPRESLEYLEIHEVYYNDEGNAVSISEKAIVPYGETLSELKDDFRRMQEAFSKPILNYSDF